MRKLCYALAAALGLVVVALGAVGLWIGVELRGSLPVLEGTLPMQGLTQPVTVERDALGVPTIRGRNRLDIARATGFLHAQERFFQMDLQRRSAAGELAELFGAAALQMDRKARVHRFRARAREASGRLPAADRAFLEAYTAGVNAGLAALSAPPFEYLILRTRPAAWLAEDSALTVLAMYVVLQDSTGKRESALGVMHDTLPKPLFDFLAPRGTTWDAPIAGGLLPPVPIPGPEVFDLRTRDRGPARSDGFDESPGSNDQAAGSNNWVVAGSLTANGSALVSNDMHLPLSVPNIWYRASFVLADARGDERRITGVTLPGGPVMIVGSNGEIAWGFTNTQGDWSDLVVIETAPGDPGSYLAPDGPRAFERHSETLVVRDGEDEVLEVVETIWGPVVDRDHRGRQRALRWVAHEPRAGNIEIQRLETASSVQEAVEIANRAGVPAQNFVVGDRDGHIAWTIIGPIPRRFGQDGSLPEAWSSGERGWAGWLAPSEYPRVVDPPSGRLWSANARNVDGNMLAKIGDGGYVNGARATQIRDGLLASKRFSERDMLAIQLDHRALFLTPWRDLLLQTLDAQAEQEDPRRPRLRSFVEQWGGHAAVDSVGYRVVREFRLAVAKRAFTALIQDCVEVEPDFDFGRAGRQQEGPLWQLVTARPRHLLDPRYGSWDALLLDAVDQVLADAGTSTAELGRYTWGAYNTADIRHPMSRFLPMLSPWLDMPTEPLAGDSNMPRSQTHAYGVSERINVSPGHEEEGIFEMPTGQSAHPLSPFFGLGHDAWVKGEPTPFLPGPPVYVLQLVPGG